jgi:uncharacterized protein (TIGR02284 family)
MHQHDQHQGRQNMAPGEHMGTLNSLLRGEIAATETYQQALAKVGADPAALELRKMHDDHREAANTLRVHVHDHGGKPDQESGVWGVWAHAVEGTAKMFGHDAALKALKEGEEHGAKSYESALEDEHLPADCKTLIRSTLLPRTKAHISMLDHLMASHS